MADFATEQKQAKNPDSPPSRAPIARSSEWSRSIAVTAFVSAVLMALLFFLTGIHGTSSTEVFYVLTLVAVAVGVAAATTDHPRWLRVLLVLLAAVGVGWLLRLSKSPFPGW